eukprot:SAG11_NODE_647_length_7957_cov_2.900903_3_plen_74_part_00
MEPQAESAGGTPVKDEEDDVYEVESILKMRRKGKKQRRIEFLVKWQGYDESHNTCDLVMPVLSPNCSRHIVLD